MSSATRQIDPESTRREILDAAQKLFIAKGFSGTSMNAIAKEAGVTKSLIFHHFESKEGLWREMAIRSHDAFHEVQMVLYEEETDLLKTLLRSIRAQFKMYQEHPEMLRLQMWEHLDGLECQQKPDEVIVEGLRRFRMGLDSGLLRDDVAPEFALTIFVGLLQQWFIMRSAFKDLYVDVDPGKSLSDDELDERFLDSMVKVYLSGILSPAAVAQLGAADFNK